MPTGSCSSCADDLSAFGLTPGSAGGEERPSGRPFHETPAAGRRERVAEHGRARARRVRASKRMAGWVPGIGFRQVIAARSMQKGRPRAARCRGGHVAIATGVSVCYATLLRARKVRWRCRRGPRRHPSPDSGPEFLDGHRRFSSDEGLHEVDPAVERGPLSRSMTRVRCPGDPWNAAGVRPRVERDAGRPAGRGRWGSR